MLWKYQYAGVSRSNINYDYHFLLVLHSFLLGPDCIGDKKVKGVSLWQPVCMGIQVSVSSFQATGAIVMKIFYWKQQRWCHRSQGDSKGICILPPLAVNWRHETDSTAVGLFQSSRGQTGSKCLDVLFFAGCMLCGNCCYTYTVTMAKHNIILAFVVWDFLTMVYVW